MRLYCWVQHYAPEMEKRPRWYGKRPSIERNWRVDETYVTVKGPVAALVPRRRQGPGEAAEDRLCVDQGLRGHARPSQGPGRALAVWRRRHAKRAPDRKAVRRRHRMTPIAARTGLGSVNCLQQSRPHVGCRPSCDFKWLERGAWEQTFTTAPQVGTFTGPRTRRPNCRPCVTKPPAPGASTV